MANIRWDGSFDNTWDAGANWVGGVAPADGDDVSFLAGDLVGVACAVGPAAPVTLISITDDAGFSAAAGAGSDICFANITVTTVNCLSDVDIVGGTIATANLTGTGANINGAATVETANLDGASTGIAGAATITTLYLNGAPSWASNAGLSVTTAYLNGAGSKVNQATFGTVYLDGSAVELLAAGNYTTVYVNSLNADISATTIAAGRITNGPYIMNRDAILYDYDTGLIMLDTSRVLLNHEGSW